MKIDLEYIQHLAQNREGVDVEFKETTGQLNRGMETLCGMLNGPGGIVVFGITNNGNIVGQEIGDKTTRMIGEAINKFDPAVDIQPEYVPVDNSDKHLNLSGTTHNRLYREDKLEIPYDALREGVVNAYCHMRWGYEIATVGIAIYDDCIVIENAGRFPVRISPSVLMQKEEEDRKNTSMPPNPIIANVMYIGGLIEHWGRGLSMMARECERGGLPTPTFYQDGTVVKITFARPENPTKENNDTVEHSVDIVEVQSEHSRSTGRVQSKVYDVAIIRLVRTIGEDWLTSYDIRELMSFKSKTTFRQNYLTPAIKLGLVRLENPDKPNSPNQRYGLTLKGKALYYEHHKDEKNDPQKDFEGQNDPQRIQADPQKASIINAIKENNEISRAKLAHIAGCSESTIKRRLKEWDIAWLGHPKTGHWVLVKDIK